EEESSDSEEEEEEHLASTVPAPAQYSYVSKSDETEPFEEGETAATPPQFGYRIAARISVQPHILMPFRSEYEIGKSSVAAAAKQIRPTLTIAESRRADERRYFRTVATHYAHEVAQSRDYYARIMDYCQLREVHTSTLVTQMEVLRREKMAPKRRTMRLNPCTTLVTTPSTTTTSITNAQLHAIINKGVNAALAARDATRNGDDSHTSGTGARRHVQAARKCSYFKFLKCKPLDFKGTKGVVELTRWFEKMESVFSISSCTASNQVKFATYTLQDDALTWWNSYV
nr:hypothetical protein [Tanacetum cinerariifolium]